MMLFVLRGVDVSDVCNAVSLPNNYIYSLVIENFN